MNFSSNNLFISLVDFSILFILIKIHIILAVIWPKLVVFEAWVVGIGEHVSFWFDKWLDAFEEFMRSCGGCSCEFAWSESEGFS